MASGTCGCLSYDLTQGDDYKTVMALLAYMEFYIGGYSDDIQRQVVEIICSGVLNFGEHSQVSGLMGLHIYVMPAAWDWKGWKGVGLLDLSVVR